MAYSYLPNERRYEAASQMAETDLPFIPPPDYLGPQREKITADGRTRTRAEVPPFSYVPTVNAYMGPREPAQPTADYATGYYPFNSYGIPDQGKTSPTNRNTSADSDHFHRHSGQAWNAALQRHFDNHLKFDTVRSRQTHHKRCPICQAIEAPPGEQNGHRSSYRARQHTIDEEDEIEENQRSRRTETFLQDLRRRGAVAALVREDRVAKNSRELTVARGEYIEVLSDTRSRRWWDCSNIAGQTGYVPDTILQVLRSHEIDELAQPPRDYRR